MGLLPTIPAHQTDASSHVLQGGLDTGNTSLHGPMDEGGGMFLAQDASRHTLLSLVAEGFPCTHLPAAEGVTLQPRPFHQRSEETGQNTGYLQGKPCPQLRPEAPVPMACAFPAAGD